MIGKFAPALVLAVVTLGGAAAVEGSAGAAVVAEEIGGEVGTIERLAAATEDAGDIEKVDNVLDTVKDDEAAKRALAKDFYLSHGFSEDDAESHMAGIDFSKPVEVISLDNGVLLEQKQISLNQRGDYYSDIGVPATKVGVNPNIRDDLTGEIKPRVVVRYTTEGKVRVLKSVAFKIVDTWSDLFNPYQTEGGGLQYFTTEKDAIKEVGNDR